MIVSFHPCFEADRQVILGSRRFDESDARLIREAEAVILPQARLEDFPEDCMDSCARIFPSYEMRLKYPGKTGQSRLFHDFGCAHPRTRCWSDVETFKNTCPDMSHIPHQTPFFVKDDKSHEAEGVFWIDSPATLSWALDTLKKRERSGNYGFITQGYVPSQGNVLRTVIIGEKLTTYWKRPSKTGQIITTISKGAKIDHHWEPHLQKRGASAAGSFARKTGTNLAAVDFVFNHSETDPDPIFLEINYYFGRKGLGGSEQYYARLYDAIRNWLKKDGLNPDRVKLV